ncbi:PucR-like helix-turn-helix protein [Scopulibacillus darangshiensis]|uniref:PucR-like helix-turn-helix protein n=1 Tax=Scopulibacillus darangshiensis TaxID=442528 RepID=A0A4R2P3H7_9BACL|nr:helix-turn-helix domain-containing protein [Scopulibacillus darangshiensis]TCP29300.1 PucR-like helix-turn-helix protein [Scopulibacillus darangshiensis]
MLDKIKAMYGKAFIEGFQAASVPEQYEWFRTEDHIIFGILKSKLTNKEARLLSIAFIPMEAENLKKTKAERIWSSLLLEGKILDRDKGDTIFSNFFYMIHFFLKEAPDDKADFEEAINGLLSVSFTIVWENHIQGVIVVHHHERARHEEMADIIATDFYIDISIMVSQVTSLQNGHAYYVEQKKLFFAARRLYPGRHVFYHENLLPLSLIQTLPSEKRNVLFGQNNQMDHIDPELIHSVSVFFEHNLNLTTASKALFIHRNSLQYRIDRFYEATRLDPKHFHDAVIISLLILDQKYEQFVQLSQK